MLDDCQPLESWTGSVLRQSETGSLEYAQAQMPQVVKPSRPTLTRLGNASPFYCIAWMVAFPGMLAAIDAAAGIDLARANPAVFVAVWCSPVVLLYVFWLTWPWTGRLPVYSAFLKWPQPRAEVDAAGLRLTVPDGGERYFVWDEIGSLLAIPGREKRKLGPVAFEWGAGLPSELRAPDGTVIAQVPVQLVRSTGPTLAACVLRAQPRRYVGTGARYRGWPGGFVLSPRARQ
jgi:hypothetical protein